MRTEDELKIFRKPSIEYLKRLYNKSVSYLFDNKYWKSELSYSKYTLRGVRGLKRTRKSIKKLGNELRIFKAPSIDNLKAMYYKSMAYVFEKKSMEFDTSMFTEEYPTQYWDLSVSGNSYKRPENELNIFYAPTIDNLKLLYYKSIGKK